MIEASNLNKKENSAMSVRLRIIAAIKQIAEEQKVTLPPLTDDLSLHETGFDSLAFAILVARLEDDLGSDPFTLADEGDRWVGRGACDMKGFLAVAANLAATVDPERLRAPLALVFTYDEEVGTLGARRLLESYGPGPSLPRAAVIGEPTSLRVARAHKGHLKLRITLTGKSAHSGYPHLGVNAIEPAGRIIGALAALRAELEREEPLHRELFPVPLTLNKIHCSH